MSIVYKKIIESYIMRNLKTNLYVFFYLFVFLMKQLKNENVFDTAVFFHMKISPQIFPLK